MSAFLFYCNKENFMSCKYTKQQKTYKEQLKILKSRNIVISDDEKTIEIIKHCNYFRLTAYSLLFEKERHIYNKKVKFDDILFLYEFDRKLRLLLDEILEIIEISIKSILAYQLSHKYGAFAHIKAENFDFTEKLNHKSWLEHIKKETEKSKEIFLSHYKKKYSEYPNLPIWMAVEVMSFGEIVRLVINLKKEDKVFLAKEFGLYIESFDSCILSFNYIRNLCAHFGRLIFKDLALRIKIPKKNKNEWNLYADKNKIGIILICLKRFCSNIDSNVFNINDWEKRIKNLVSEIEAKKNDSINLDKLIGLKSDWQKIF